MLSARTGMAAVVAVAAVSCVNLKYPPGATRQGDGGVTLHLPRGQPCRVASDCQDGFCVDGVCCKDKCDGLCMTCARSGSEGFCSVAELGTDVREQCADEGASSCGQNGTCDGNGACDHYGAGTVCLPAQCQIDSLTPVSRCKDGQCVTPPAQSCTPFLCSGVDLVCLTTCDVDKSCTSPNRCINGTCGAKPLGSPCGAASDCASSFCEDGVCCATSCTGGCQSCALVGSAGTCTSIPAGQAPVDPAACVMMDPSTCQADGTCDGAGGCRLHQAGKMCGAASCSTATLHGASTCDGKGKCQTPAAVTCGGYTCASVTACRTTCGADTDCASPSVCHLDACGGLTAQFFRQTNLTDLAYTHTDPWIDFDWGLGAPAGLNVDNFSIRWKGKITPRFSETYTFFAASDDGERLYVDDVLIIDHFIRHASVPEDVSKPIVLQAGQPVDITFEYFENGGDANVVMSWQSPSEPKAVVPTSALSPQ